MPRSARAVAGGICYHVPNRGNARRAIFLKDDDYQAFLKALGHACLQVPLRVLAYCLMPNHFHIVVWPKEDGDLSRWLQWLLNAHVRRYHQHYHSSGHIWQGRSKSFPIASDEHLLTVLRYVERNPVRARLTRRAERWRWCSAWGWRDGEQPPAYLDKGPAERRPDWLHWVNEPQTEAELQALRTSVSRGRPFGAVAWVKQMAARLGLEKTLRPRGRPRKDASKR
jgi:putative transposase